MVPNQHLPSQLGEIPDDWKRVRLSDVMKVRQGLQIAISERLKTPTVTSKEYITIQSIKKTEQGREYVEAPTQRVICEKEDVLMTRTGNTGIVVTDVEGVFHNNFFLMDFKRNQIDKTFLVNYLRSTRVQHLILTKAGASTIPDLNHNDFYSIEFPLASLPEQRKIALILSTWDKAISSTERLIDNSKQQKKALMQQLLTGKKRLLDDSGKPFEGEWVNIKLKDISTFITKGATPTTYGYEWQDSGIPFLRSECVGENGFKDSGLAYISEEAHEVMRRSKVFTGDILITITGNVGRVCQLPDSISEANLNQHIAKVTISSESVASTFVYHVLSNSAYRRNFERITTGQAYPQLSLEQIRNAVIDLPSKNEQRKIAAVLTNADKEIEFLEKQLADLKQEKKALMQQLLTGERRVKVDDKEVA
tara:strand:- start:907 stop:2169 length:1263 start_codon:yes stop_codon:yes gene_type:complete